MKTAEQILEDAKKKFEEAQAEAERRRKSEDNKKAINHEEACIEKFGYYWNKDHTEHLLCGTTKEGLFVKQTPNNYAIIIDHLGEVRYSIIDQCSFFNGKLVDTNTALDIKMKVNAILGGISASNNDISDALDYLALAHKFNKFKDYLDSLPMVKTNHLDSWLVKVVGAEDNELNRIIGRKWLISYIARGVSPGCYVEGALILSGGQGAAKTLFAQTLVPEPCMYFCDSIELNNTQKMAQTLCGATLVEMGELSQLNRVNIEEIKECLTRKEDTFVPKYSNRRQLVPRCWVAIGSTNELGILIDTSGNRRFWCVKVSSEFDINYLKSIKQELLSEAYQEYNRLLSERKPDDFRDPWVLSTEERELLDESNGMFEVEDSLVGYIDENLQRLYNYKTNPNWIDYHKIAEIAKLHDRNVTDKRLARLLVNSLKMEKNPKIT